MVEGELVPNQVYGNYGYTGSEKLSISGNWRVIFRFGNGQAIDVDIIDYRLKKNYSH